ncbi:MAG: FeoB-associated Cys-rich membrane protein [Ruminococcus sp.]|uniref:FeoB-associated Cys-rich membrane protein n=1 Tax=Ruminococcus sp. TaxID=41978 RepID=UPI0025F3E4D7|nr:FeoB-associated Cys-rich membrane protein [Ruminococcus sp.]MBO4866871.1 FeoB-associated Cys-rich membrane protein [Ruminococcus sp.]
MTVWLSENIGNIIVITIVEAILALALRSVIKDRMSGKGGCGCGCSSCAMKGKCHPAKK